MEIVNRLVQRGMTSESLLHFPAELFVKQEPHLRPTLGSITTYTTLNTNNNYLNLYLQTHLYIYWCIHDLK